MKRAQDSWMAHVRLGDVLESACGTQRVVRKVSRYKDGELRSVTFAIKHCSWTHRPYTVLSYTDLRSLGYRPVGVRMPLRNALDKRLARAIADHNWRGGPSCCAVRGIA